MSSSSSTSTQYHPSRPSHLSASTSFSQSIHPSKLREAQQKRMAYTYTFQLAQRARVKLQREASRHDHNLRLLVGHANLLDSLMISLVEAGREQENWFNETVRGNMAQEHDDDEEDDDEVEQESVHMVENSNSRSWQPEAEGRVMMTQYDDESDDSDSDSECSEDEMEDVRYSMPPLTRRPSYKSLPYFGAPTIGVAEVEEYDDDFPEDDEEGDEDGMYPLQRTASHGSPPMLVADLSDDEDEPTPPSPPVVSLPFTPSSKMQSSPPPFSEGEQFIGTDYLSSNTLISTY